MASPSNPWPTSVGRDGLLSPMKVKYLRYLGSSRANYALPSCCRDRAHTTHVLIRSSWSGNAKFGHVAESAEGSSTKRFCNTLYHHHRRKIHSPSATSSMHERQRCSAAGDCPFDSHHQPQTKTRVKRLTYESQILVMGFSHGNRVRLDHV